jgi:hypothetical protein
MSFVDIWMDERYSLEFAGTDQQAVVTGDIKADRLVYSDKIVSVAGEVLTAEAQDYLRQVDSARAAVASAYLVTNSLGQGK